MSAITREFTKEQLIEKLQHRISVASGFPESEKAQMDLELARIALESLELERGMIRRFDLDMSDCDSCGQDCGADMVEDLDGEYVLWDEVLPHLYRYDEYTIPPAPVSVPAAMEMDDDFDSAFEHGKAVGWNACRSAMLQGAEPVTTAYKLPEGWVAVPVNATRAMIDAAARVEEDGYDAMHKAMIAAAPQQEVKP